MKNWKRVLIVLIVTILLGCRNQDKNVGLKETQGLLKHESKVYRDFDMFSFKPEHELTGDLKYPFAMTMYNSSGKLDSILVKFDKKHNFTSRFHYLQGVPYTIDADHESKLRTFFVPPYVYSIEYVTEYLDGEEKPTMYIVNASRMSRITKDSVVEVNKCFHKKKLFVKDEKDINHMVYFRNEKHTTLITYMVIKGDKYISKSSQDNFISCYERGQLGFFWCYYFWHVFEDCKDHDNHHGDG